MPAYEVALNGRKYRVDAANEEELQATVAELEREQRTQAEEDRHTAATDESPRTRGWFSDVVASAARGPLKAVDAAAKALAILPEDAGIYFRDGGVHFTQGDARNALEAGIDALGAPQTRTGAVVEGVSQFAAGAVPVFRGAKAVGFLQGTARATTALRGVTLGAATSGVFFDGQEANLANLVEAAPALSNPLTEFLATDEDTPELEGRLKNAVMDAVGGVAVEGVIALAKIVKAGRKVKPHVLDESNSDAIKPPDEAKPAEAATAPEAKPKDAPEASPAAADEPPASTTVEALESKATAYADLSTDQAVSRLSTRYGITGEKLGQFRQALQRGVPGEDIEKILDLNPDYIDWGNIRNAEDVVAVLNTMTRVMGDTVASKAGYARQTIEFLEEQAAKLADETGGGYDTAVGILERVRELPAVVILQRKLVTASATHLRNLAERVLKGAATPTDLLEFVAHERRHALLQVTVRGTRANVGRALRVMQEGVRVSEDALRLANARGQREARKAAGQVPKIPTRKLTADEAEDALRQVGLDTKKVRSLAEYIATHPDLDEVNRVARMSLWEKTQDKLTALYINNILSGMPTMMVNVFSGFYKMVESTIEAAGAGAVSAIRGGDRWERVAAAKSVAATWSSWRVAWKLTATAWREGLPQTDLMARHEVVMRGGAPEGVVEKMLSLPSRTIITIDEFFKQIFYQQELTARAVEIAAEAARLEKGKAAQDAAFKRVFGETMKAPPDDLMLDAIDKARYQTFQNDPENRLVSWLMSGTNKIPAMRLILPFIKTPYNIVAQAAERSPLALMSGRIRATLAGRHGKRAQGEMATRLVLGTSAIGWVWSMADDGSLTGSRVGGKGLRNTADMEAPPYSVRIGGKWYQYNRTDPLGTILGLTADLRLYYNNRNERLANDVSSDDPEATEAMSVIAGIFVENLADKAFFKGISDFFEAVGSTRDGGAGTFLGTYANNLVVNFVPYSSMQRNIARAHDGYAREAWTLMDKLKAQTPGLSTSLPLRRDLLGRPIQQYDRVGADWASPFIVAKDDPDPVARALAALELPYRMPDKDIAGVKMSSEQYSRVLEIRGGIVYAQIQERLNDGSWDELSRFQKVELMRRVFTAATSLAERQVMEESPDLLRAVEERRTEAAEIKAGERR